MKLIGYLVAILAGWFTRQFALVAGQEVQKSGGSFALQVLLIWFCVPIAMYASWLAAWICFLVIPAPDGRTASEMA